MHGTAQGVDAFDLNHPGRKDVGWLGDGVYLTSSPWVADEYARIKAGGKKSSPGQQIMPLYAALHNPYVASLQEKATLRRASKEDVVAWTKDLKDLGHNGMVLTFPNGEWSLVFCRVRQDVNTRRLYLHEVFLEDEVRRPDGLQTAAEESSSKPHGPVELHRKLLSEAIGVNPSSVSIALDENGEPLVRDEQYENTETGEKRAVGSFGPDAGTMRRKPPKLTLEQYIEVRSPEFKEWAEDWEAVARQETERMRGEAALDAVWIRLFLSVVLLDE